MDLMDFIALKFIKRIKFWIFMNNSFKKFFYKPVIKLDKDMSE